MRSIAVALVLISVSSTVVSTAQAQQQAEVQPGHGSMVRPAGHRQPTLAAVPETGQIKVDENGPANAIDQENARLDRLIRGICRGC